MSTLASIALNTVLQAVPTVLLAAEDTEFDETAVTPGVIGFGVTAAFAFAVILLGFSLVRRVRRINYRAEIREELAAEVAAREAEAAGSGAAGTDSAGSAGAADRPDPAAPKG